MAPGRGEGLAIIYECEVITPHEAGVSEYPPRKMVETTKAGDLCHLRVVYVHMRPDWWDACVPQNNRVRPWPAMNGLGPHQVTLLRELMPRRKAERLDGTILGITHELLAIAGLMDQRLGSGGNDPMAITPSAWRRSSAVQRPSRRAGPMKWPRP